MSEHIDPQLITAHLKATHGILAANEALKRAALSSLDGDIAALLRWEEAARLLMTEPTHDPAASTVYLTSGPDYADGFPPWLKWILILVFFGFVSITIEAMWVGL